MSHGEAICVVQAHTVCEWQSYNVDAGVWPPPLCNASHINTHLHPSRSIKLVFGNLLHCQLCFCKSRAVPHWYLGAQGPENPKKDSCSGQSIDLPFAVIGNVLALAFFPKWLFINPKHSSLTASIQDASWTEQCFIENLLPLFQIVPLLKKDHAVSSLLEPKATM